MSENPIERDFSMLSDIDLCVMRHEVREADPDDHEFLNDIDREIKRRAALLREAGVVVEDAQTGDTP